MLKNSVVICEFQKRQKIGERVDANTNTNTNTDTKTNTKTNTKNKDKVKVNKILNMCYIFEKQRVQGYQI